MPGEVERVSRPSGRGQKWRPVTGEPAQSWVDHFRHRVLQDAYLEASAAYWLRRAETFARVGTPACDEIAQACRNRATLGDISRAELDDTLHDIAQGAA